MASVNKRAPGWWYPWLFVGGMGIVIVVNGIMAYFAVSTWAGLETEDHYTKGIAYNETIDRLQRQATLGWSADINLNDDNLSAVFKDSYGIPIEGLAVTALLYRPSRDDIDREIILVPAAPGHYRANPEFPLPGLWEVRLSATRGEDSYRLRRRIQVP